MLIEIDDNGKENINPKSSAVPNQMAEAFIKGAVFSWCINTPEDCFSVNRLFGYDWNGTPLQSIHNSNNGNYSTSRQEVGKLLKKVLIEYEEKQFIRYKDCCPHLKKLKKDKGLNYIGSKYILVPK